MVTKKIVELELGREVKHSVRYEEIGDPNESDSEAIRNSVTGTIYIRKNHLPRPYPKRLTLTLEFHS